MRLFYALEFDARTKDSMALLQQDIISYCPKCLFTRSVNLHLTLCFLGEVEGQSLTVLKEILFSLEAKPLLLKFNKLGLFHKRQGDIIWLGIEENAELEALQGHLANELRGADFLLEDQKFHPHVTLARGARRHKLPAIESLEAPCDRISLMHSHHKQNTLTYTPIFTKPLQQTATI